MPLEHIWAHLYAAGTLINAPPSVTETLINALSECQFTLTNCVCAGVVPEPARQVAQAGQHEEGAGPARPQRPPPDLQRRAHPPRGDQAQGAAAQGAQAH